MLFPIIVLLLAAPGVRPASAEMQGEGGFILGWHRSGGHLAGETAVTRKSDEVILLPNLDGYSLGVRGLEYERGGCKATTVELRTNAGQLGASGVTALQLSILVEKQGRDSEELDKLFSSFFKIGGGFEVLWTSNANLRVGDHGMPEAGDKWWYGATFACGAGIDLWHTENSRFSLEATYRLTAWGFHFITWAVDLFDSDHSAAFIGHDLSLAVVRTAF